ncbi:hypothetical protein RhiirA4_456512 [Rhizophagus irregularis]|uniref:Uncharacterized protein n=1 Tax=Rhizophagus irregularis TaxID=588596 RepID=A0A2I1G7S0_9GLOM|nr:hypothetical protein RhiirA4_456512 [Rhizophagus irregularis]
MHTTFLGYSLIAQFCSYIDDKCLIGGPVPLEIHNDIVKNIVNVHSQLIHVQVVP